LVCRAGLVTHVHDQHGKPAKAGGRTAPLRQRRTRSNGRRWMRGTAHGCSGPCPGRRSSLCCHWTTVCCSPRSAGMRDTAQRRTQNQTAPQSHCPIPQARAHESVRQDRRKQRSHVLSTPGGTHLRRNPDRPRPAQTWKS
jgi:hypothetical protein